MNNRGDKKGFKSPDLAPVCIVATDRIFSARYLASRLAMQAVQ